MVAGIVTGIGLGLAGNYLGGLGADRERRRQQRLIEAFDRESQRLGNRRRGYIHREGMERLGDLDQVLNAFNDFGGAGESRDAVVADARQLAGPKTTTQAGTPEAAKVQASARSSSDERVGAARRSDDLQKLMQALGRGQRGAARGSTASRLGRAPGLTENLTANQLAALKAELDLRRALGDRDGTAQTMQLIGALLSGAGGLTTRYAGMQ